MLQLLLFLSKLSLVFEVFPHLSGPDESVFRYQWYIAPKVAEPCWKFHIYSIRSCHYTVMPHAHTLSRTHDRSGVRCLPFPRPTFINVSSHLPNAKPKKHSPVLLQHEVLLSYLRLCFLKWCVLFFNISFSKLSSALSSFTRHSSESLAVSLKVPSLSPSQSHCPLCVPYRKQFRRCLLSALVFWLCVYHGKALFAVFATTISMRGTQRARLLALH